MVPDSYANFVFVKHPKIDGEELFLALRKEGIIVRHWNKPLIDQYLRVTIGTDQQMERFFEFLENYLNQKDFFITILYKKEAIAIAIAFIFLLYDVNLL